MIGRLVLLNALAIGLSIGTAMQSASSFRTLTEQIKKQDVYFAAELAWTRALCVHDVPGPKDGLLDE